MKYFASGTVDQMSMYGRIVRPLGSQRNLPVTSARGFSELETMTYTGTRTKPVSRVRKIRRDQRNELVGAMGDLSLWVSDIGRPPSARGERQIHARHHQQEEQQQYGHRRAGAEVPRDEGRLVDVDRDE